MYWLQSYKKKAELPSFSAEKYDFALKLEVDGIAVPLVIDHQRVGHLIDWREQESPADCHVITLDGDAVEHLV